MRAAGLKAISTVVESTAVLIKSKHPSDHKLVDLIASRIRGVISACTYSFPFLGPFCPHYHKPLLSELITNALSQPHKSTSSARTTSSAPSLKPHAGSRPASAPPPSTALRRRAGSLSVRWWSGRILPASWTNWRRRERRTFSSRGLRIRGRSHDEVCDCLRTLPMTAFSGSRKSFIDMLSYAIDLMYIQSDSRAISTLDETRRQ